jgi:hypothetical protein
MRVWTEPGEERSGRDAASGDAAGERVLDVK